MAHGSINGVEPTKKIKRYEQEESKTGLSDSNPIVQKIGNIFNNYVGFVNNNDVSVWNNHESSQASSQF